MPKRRCHYMTIYSPSNQFLTIFLVQGTEQFTHYLAILGAILVAIFGAILMQQEQSACDVRQKAALGLAVSYAAVASGPYPS